jgi:hypothetical protein
VPYRQAMRSIGDVVLSSERRWAPNGEIKTPGTVSARLLAWPRDDHDTGVRTYAAGVLEASADICLIALHAREFKLISPCDLSSSHR